MDEAPSSYPPRCEPLGQTERWECALSFPGVCQSTYEGDIDEEKLGRLAEIETVRVFLDGSEPIDIHVCGQCLQKVLDEERWIK